MALDGRHNSAEHWLHAWQSMTERPSVRPPVRPYSDMERRRDRPVNRINTGQNNYTEAGPRGRAEPSDARR